LSYGGGSEATGDERVSPGGAEPKGGDEMKNKIKSPLEGIESS